MTELLEKIMLQKYDCIKNLEGDVEILIQTLKDLVAEYGENIGISQKISIDMDGEPFIQTFVKYNREETDKEFKNRMKAKEIREKRETKQELRELKRLKKKYKI